MPLIISIYLFFSNNVLARSLKATADKLAQETRLVGYEVGLFGLVIAGIYFVVGKQDASVKLTQAVFGLLVLYIGPNIINFIKGLA